MEGVLFRYRERARREQREETVPRITTKRATVQKAFAELDKAPNREREEMTVTEAIANGKAVILKKIRENKWSIDEVVEFLQGKGVNGAKATMKREVSKIVKDGGK